MKKIYGGLLIVLILAGVSFGLYVHKRDLAADQSACQSMAQKVVEDYQDRKTESGLPAPNDTLSNRAHYNSALKGCFVELADSFGNSDVSVTSTVIMNAPEEDNLGGCLETIQGKGHDVTTSCHDADNNTISYDTFKTLDAKYLGDSGGLGFVHAISSVVQ